MEIIHTDVCGSFKTALNGERYFVSFIDDYSKISKVYCIKSKDEVFICLVQFINKSENLTGKRGKQYDRMETPFEIFFKRQPSVEHLRLFGSRVFVRKPEQN